MTESRNRELAISATSKIYEKVNDALRKRDTDKRWFWELLQNAKDTVVYKKGEETSFNLSGKKVDVRLEFSSNGNGEKYLKFEHNGNPFKYSNHKYKYDDPKCLLLSDSGKIEEEDSQREDITGQFGTGFLTTHILSLRILVEGIFLDKKLNFNSFKFELDRQFNSKLQLAEKVENSLDQYENNFTSIEPINEFKTSFTYYINDNKDGLEEGIKTVKTGIDGVEKYIPFVLSFSKEIRSVNISFEDKILEFKREIDLQKQDKLTTIVKIIRTERSSIESYNTKPPENIYVTTISDIENNIDLAIKLYSTDTGLELRELEKDQAVLFCTFPLIGSENWRFPLIFNSSKFYPETERNGISLLKDKDYGNRHRVLQALELFKIFTNDLIQKNYLNLHFLADTRVENCPMWCDEEWYKSTLNELREFLLTQPIVINEFNNPILLKDSLMPTIRGAEKLDDFWDICFGFIGNNIPSKKDIHIWNKMLVVEYKPWVALKYDLKRLLNDIQNLQNLQNLANEKFDGNKEKTIAWLSVVYDFILLKAEQKELFDEYEILPNQDLIGTFKKLEDLRFDVDIPEELKDVLNFFKQDKRDKLIHKAFIIFRDHQPLSVDDVSYSINKYILDKEKVETQEFKNAMYLLCSYFTTEFSEKRNTIYSFALDFYPGITPNEKRILANTSDFNWENVNKWVVKSITFQIETLENLINLQNHFNQTDINVTIIWLNKFINFISSTADLKEFLSNNKITPNQYDELCSIDQLYNDVDIIPNILKGILYDLSNKKEDWKAELLHEDITLNLNKPRSLKDISTLIDDYVKNNRDNLENPTIRNAILSLVKWVSDNKETFRMDDLFKWFDGNKANLVLSTLDSGNDRDSIFDIIQSGQSLEALAKVAKSSLTTEQLNTLAENPELFGRFLAWLNSKQKDNPNEELGDIGEEFVYFYLCNLFGNDNVEWSKQNEFDFRVFNIDKSTRYYIDAKTTSYGISNSDNVPFYMRTSQWNFLPKEEVKNKYLIARVFKTGEQFSIRFLNIKPEEIKRNE